MEKELKIVPPEGYEIDKENSTLECIKFKPLIKRWREDLDLISNKVYGLSEKEVHMLYEQTHDELVKMKVMYLLVTF